jgi:uncharacterized protein (TIGR02646 family)
MKNIIKNSEPQAFIDWKSNKHFTKQDLINNPNLINDKVLIWKKFTKKAKVKNEIKKSLLEEQGYICCYCQNEIDETKMTIEHLNCRNCYPTEMFDYNNLMSCCDGGQHIKNLLKSDAYCGHFKKDQSIKVNPFTSKCENHFRYDDEGNIYHNSSIDGDQTIRKLNLRSPKLKSLRKAAIDGFLHENLNNTIPISEKYLESLKISLNSMNNGKYFPFCIVIINILNS